MPRPAPRARAGGRAKRPISSCSGSWPTVAAISSRVDRGAARPRVHGPCARSPASTVRKPDMPGGLAQRREPARAEVDRVQREAERGALLQRAVEVRRGRRDRRERLRVGLDRLVDHAHESRARCHARAGGADVVGQAHGRPTPGAPTRDPRGRRPAERLQRRRARARPGDRVVGAGTCTSWLERTPPPLGRTSTTLGHQRSRPSRARARELDLDLGAGRCIASRRSRSTLPEHGREPGAAARAASGPCATMLDSTARCSSTSSLAGSGTTSNPAVADATIVPRPGDVDQLRPLGEVLEREPPVDRSGTQELQRDVALGVGHEDRLGHKPGGYFRSRPLPSETGCLTPPRSTLSSRA